MGLGLGLGHEAHAGSGAEQKHGAAPRLVRVRVGVGVGVGVGARVRVRVRVRVCGAAPRLGRHDGAREVEQRTHVRRARALGRRSEGGEPGLHLEVKIDGVHMAGGRTVLWWVGGKMAKEESPGFTWSGEW